MLWKVGLNQQTTQEHTHGNLLSAQNAEGPAGQRLPPLHCRAFEPAEGVSRRRLTPMLSSRIGSSNCLTANDLSSLPPAVFCSL